ncbi:hypothetical protein DFH28DRAFT_1109658 [Melampsora americana]|nr:hypothetical protein DFH28DRAFT_1109658 [Melampsora americana]
MIPSQDLIPKIFLLSAIQIFCVLINEPRGVRTTPTIHELNISPNTIKSHCSSQMAAHSPAVPADGLQGLSTLGVQRQTEELELQERSHNSLDIQGSHGRKRKIAIDLNLPYDISQLEQNQCISPETIKSHGTSHISAQSPAVPDDGLQCLSTSTVQRQAEILELPDRSHNSLDIQGSHGRKRKFTIDLNLPCDISPQDQNKSKNQKFTNAIDEVSKRKKKNKLCRENLWYSEEIVNDSQKLISTAQPVELVPSPAPSMSGTSNVLQNESNARKPVHHRYKFKQSGESALLTENKVIKVGNTWHAIAPQRQIFIQLKKQGLRFLKKQSLCDEGINTQAWFRDLRKDMQLKLVHDTGSYQESSEISRAIFRASKPMTTGLIGSLQIIHSSESGEIEELTHDGLHFIQKFLNDWRLVNWEFPNFQHIDTSDCSKTYTPFQILGYLIRSKRKSHISMCIIWSLCNSWYKSSNYKDKKDPGTYEDFFMKIHHYLVNKELFPEMEVELEQTPSIYHQRKPSNREKLRENIHLKDNSTKRTVSMFKTVGRGILKDLLNEGLSLGFIDEYGNHMKLRSNRFPTNWKGNLNSLKRTVKLELFPCFLGMIQVLHPSKTVKGQPNPMVLNGFNFLKELLRGWREDDLARACQKEPRSINSLDTCIEVSSVILAYILSLKPGKDTRLALSLFFGLWKVWKRGEVSKAVKNLVIETQPDFMRAIGKAYVTQKLLH